MQNKKKSPALRQQERGRAETSQTSYLSMSIVSRSPQVYNAKKGARTVIDDYIPVGRDNRISSKSLAYTLGYKSVRELQTAVEDRR